jgi:hypothetical protein
VLNESRKVDLFELNHIIIFPIIKLLRLIDIRIRLHYLIDPLFYDPHVRHHIDLRDPLRPEQLGILLAVEEVEYLLDARHDRLDAALPVVEVEREPLRLALQLPQLHLHLLDVSAPLDILVRQVCGVTEPLNLLGEGGDLVLKAVDILGLIVDELKETEVALLSLDELGH